MTHFIGYLVRGRIRVDCDRAGRATGRPNSGSLRPSRPSGLSALARCGGPDLRRSSNEGCASSGTKYSENEVIAIAWRRWTSTHEVRRSGTGRSGVQSEHRGGPLRVDDKNGRRPTDRSGTVNAQGPARTACSREEGSRHNVRHPAQAAPMWNVYTAGAEMTGREGATWEGRRLPASYVAARR